MIIVGAKGFAKETLEVLLQSGLSKENLCFFDDVSDHLPSHFCDVPIYSNMDDLIDNNPIETCSFVLGLGSPGLRKKMMDRFKSVGFKASSCISPKSTIGVLDNNIGEGVSIMTGAVLTSSIRLGKGSLLNLNCTVGHDVIIGDFCEFSPGAKISGRCEIGDFVQIGTNATIIPDIKIGSNSIIGAGSVVVKEVPSNVVMAGVPAKVIREL